MKNSFSAPLAKLLAWAAAKRRRGLGGPHGAPALAVSAATGAIEAPRLPAWLRERMAMRERAHEIARKEGSEAELRAWIEGMEEAERRAAVNWAELMGQTPLMAAVSRRRVENARVLLERGADPFARSRCWASRISAGRFKTTAYEAALEALDKESLKLLTAIPGWDSRVAEDAARSLAGLAMEHADLEILALVATPRTTRAGSEDEETALMIAARQGLEEALDILEPVSNLFEWAAQSQKRNALTNSLARGWTPRSQWLFGRMIEREGEANFRDLCWREVALADCALLAGSPEGVREMALKGADPLKEQEALEKNDEDVKKSPNAARLRQGWERTALGWAALARDPGTARSATRMLAAASQERAARGLANPQETREALISVARGAVDEARWDAADELAGACDLPLADLLRGERAAGPENLQKMPIWRARLEAAALSESLAESADSQKEARGDNAPDRAQSGSARRL